MVALGRQGSTASSPFAAHQLYQLSLVDADWLTGSDGKQPCAAAGGMRTIDPLQTFGSGKRRPLAKQPCGDIAWGNAYRRAGAVRGLDSAFISFRNSSIYTLLFELNQRRRMVARSKLSP